MVNQKRWDLAANRYYYACFQELDKQFGRFFSRMIQLRMKADYNSVAEVTEAEVLEMAPLSASFINSIKTLLPAET